MTEPVTEPEGTCNCCEYWWKGTTNDGYGTCHFLHPPRPGFIGAWRKIVCHKNSYCDFWKLKGRRNLKEDENPRSRRPPKLG